MLGPSFKLFQDEVAWYNKKMDLSHKSDELRWVIHLIELVIIHNILSHKQNTRIMDDVMAPRMKNYDKFEKSFILLDVRLFIVCY